MMHKETVKLVIATPLYPPDIGGPATYTVQLEEELPKQGIDVQVVSFTASRRFPKGMSHIHFAWQLFKATAKTDAVLAQDPISVGLPTALVCKLRRCHFLIRMPGDYAWEQSRQRFGVTDSIDNFQTKRYGWRVELLRTLQQWVTRQADKVVTPSEYFSRLVRGWGTRTDTVVTVYNGLRFIPPAQVEKPAGKVLVTAGRLVPWKGFAKLTAVLPELPDWHLYIIGTGPEKERILAAAKAANVAERVHLLGSLPREEVIGWCKVADAFVLNTSFESFSFQVVEAMDTGVPVIATNVGSLPELISDGIEGVLVSPNDIEDLVAALKSIEAKPEIWQRRTQAARVKARQFSVENTATRMAALIKNMI